MSGAAVAQVIPVYARYHHVAEFERGNGLGEMAQLLGIRGKRPAVRDVAKRAAARADVAEDHESGRALAEALRDVWARGFLAHSVQLLVAQNLLDLAEARIGARRAHADPRRLGQRGLREDGGVFSRPLSLAPRLTHVQSFRKEVSRAARRFAASTLKN